MGICFVVFPAISLLFVLARVITDVENKERFITITFFSFWALFIMYSVVVKDVFKINIVSLIITVGVGLLIAIYTGVFKPYWIWTSIGNGYYHMFSVDVFWILVGIGIFYISFKLKKKNACQIKNNDLVMNTIVYILRRI